ncbi:MAG: hypothetical protein WDW36_004476 [Sanguina aurantia]
MPDPSQPSPSAAKPKAAKRSPATPGPSQPQGPRRTERETKKSGFYSQGQEPDSGGKVKGRGLSASASRKGAGQPRVKREGGAAMLDYDNGWQPWQNLAPVSAQKKALARALAHMRELRDQNQDAIAHLKVGPGVPAAPCMHVLTRSQVSGGFWAQAPAALVAATGAWGSQSKDIEMWIEEDMWEVKWLARSGTSAGFSGGWRGVAIDARLSPYDTVVVERREGVANANRLHVRVFRASDEVTGFTNNAAPTGADQVAQYVKLRDAMVVGDWLNLQVSCLRCRSHVCCADVRVLADSLGVVFQQPTLDLDLSVVANLRFHARLHGMGSAARARIDAELERIGLTAQARDRARTLSGGNRRRVELARALLHDPVVLLMDEPTVGLDLASRAQLVEYVHSLCTHRDVGVLWATHLVDEAESADRVIILHKGHWIASGTAAQLRERTGRRSLHDAFLDLTGEASVAQEEAV